MLKKSLFLLVTLILLFWVLWFVYGTVWLDGYPIMEKILKIASYIVLVIGIVTAIITFVFILRESNKGINSIKVLVFSILIIFHVLMYLFFADIGNVTSGTFQIVDKVKEEGSYYFFIEKNEKINKIKCEKTEYEFIEPDSGLKYSFSYRWLKIFPDKKVLVKESLKNLN